MLVFSFLGDIHQTELAAAPLALAVNTVAGDTGGVLHDGQALTDQLIKQHGLTHIGASDDSNQRFRHRISLHFYHQIQQFAAVGAAHLNGNAQLAAQTLYRIVIQYYYA